MHTLYISVPNVFCIRLSVCLHLLRLLLHLTFLQQQDKKIIFASNALRPVAGLNSWIHFSNDVLDI